MEALEADKREMEKRFIIQQQDVDKLKEKEVLSKQCYFLYYTLIKKQRQFFSFIRIFR
jgi:hypothetical protein